MSSGDLGVQARHFRRTFATIRPEECVCGSLPFAQLVLEFPELSGHSAHANLHEYRNAWPSSIGMGGRFDRNTQHHTCGNVMVIKCTFGKDMLLVTPSWRNT